METYRDQVRLRLAARDEMRKLAGTKMLFAVVDACDEPSVPAKVSDAGEARAVPLFPGAEAAKFKTIAPYVFQLDEKLLDWLAEFGDKAWGVYATSKSDLQALVRHFRSLLEVRGPKNEWMYFRFYDPRVLESYVIQCDDDEIRRFYGPVLAYGVAGPGIGESTSRVSNKPAPEPYSVAPIRIRPEQMQFFNAKIEREVEGRAVDKLRREHAAELKGVSDDELRRRVAGELREGREYGFTWESTLTRYAERNVLRDLGEKPARR